jgi:hypothetical protein
MSDSVQYKTRAEMEFEKHKDHYVDKEGAYICTVCKKTWVPTIEADLNKKRPSCFCKLCTRCRLKSFTKAREYKAKKGNNFDKLRDEPNN